MDGTCDSCRHQPVGAGEPWPGRGVDLYDLPGKDARALADALRRRHPGDLVLEPHLEALGNDGPAGARRSAILYHAEAPADNRRSSPLSVRSEG
jgi:hypothetical protein